MFSTSLSKYFNDLREKFSNDFADKIATYQEYPEKDESKFEEEIRNLFEEYRGFYVNRMKHFYTNWNAGLTKNGEERTFSFTFDRKSTVARANMEKMIDDSLSSGDFWELDVIYVKIRHATCRHMNRSEPLGVHPSKTDKCAVRTEMVD